MKKALDDEFKPPAYGKDVDRCDVRPRVHESGIIPIKKSISVLSITLRVNQINGRRKRKGLSLLPVQRISSST